MEISYFEEIKRKSVHLSSLWMVAATLLLAQRQWIACLIFTQALRAPASAILFGFVSIAPWASMIYALIARNSLKIYMLSDTTVTEKNKPFSYEFRLINEAFLPYPFIDAYIKLPRRSSVRTTERCVRIGMPPMSNYTVKGTVQFRFPSTPLLPFTFFPVSSPSTRAMRFRYPTPHSAPSRHPTPSISSRSRISVTISPATRSRAYIGSSPRNPRNS